MSSLLDVLTQIQPQFKTRQALLILGLQNDFVAPTGKLPVGTGLGFLDRIKTIIPRFRETGDIIWVRTVYEADRLVNITNDDGEAVILGARDTQDHQPTENIVESEDEVVHEATPPGPSPSRPEPYPTSKRALELLKRASGRNRAKGQQRSSSSTEEEELFLTSTAEREPCCLRGSYGADFAEEIKPWINGPKDIEIVKSHYSAFNTTSLLTMLRMKLITEVYICGCLTNMSVYATATDAARHGLTINILEDCLGYRQKARHEDAVKQMIELMGAYTLSSTQLLETLAEEAGTTSAGVEGGLEHTSALTPQLHNLKLSGGQLPRAAILENGAMKRRSESMDHGPGSQNSGIVQRPRIELQSEAAQSIGKGTTSREPEESMRGELRPDLHPATKQGVEKKGPKVRSRRSQRGKEGSRAKVVDSAKKEDHIPKGSHAGATETTAPPNGLIQSSSASEDTQPPAVEQASAAIHPMAPASNPSQTHSLSLGPTDRIGEGDSRIVYDLFPMTFSNPTHGQDSFFNSIYNEVRWQKMYHVQGEVPRLVCVQGEISPDGSMPVYRHPSDQSLPLLHYSSSVEQIREEVQKIVHHPINHVLIQLYRSGNDYISEHSDKTLDIVRGSSIVNVSFGAQRTMRLRTKKSADPGLGARQTHRVPMPHNSMFVLGPETNMRWLHGINADRRRLEERSEVELAYEGMRISLTFRHIGTFLNADESLIWGQGATGKSREVAAGTVSGDDAKTDAMINAFGTENHSSDFDWNATYGAGFDVLHFRAPPPILPIFFLSGDLVEDTSVLMYLEELGIRHERKHPPPPPTDPGHKIHPLAPAATQADQLAGQSSAEEVQTPKPSPKQRTVERRCCLRDTDPQHTEVASAVPILLYLDRYHSPASASTSRPAAATAFSLLTTDLPRLTASSHLASHRLPLPTASPSPLQDLLAQLNDDAARRGTAFLAGEEVGVADCAFWPLLDALGRRRAGEGEEDGAGFGTRCWWLEAWWERMRGRESVRRAVGDGRGGGGKVRVEGA